MQAYSDPKRENNPHALPDCEVWKDRVFELTCDCGVYDLPAESVLVLGTGENFPCPSGCGKAWSTTGKRFKRTKRSAWWWQSCSPGCMPDSDTFGPFDTEEAALADAQSNAEDSDDEEPDDDSDPTEPDEGDYILEPMISFGSRYRVTQYGKALESFGADEDKTATDRALTWIRKHMDREHFYPNIWLADDHGGYTRTQLD